MPNISLAKETELEGPHITVFKNSNVKEEHEKNIQDYIDSLGLNKTNSLAINSLEIIQYNDVGDYKNENGPLIVYKKVYVNDFVGYQWQYFGGGSSKVHVATDAFAKKVD